MRLPEQFLYKMKEMLGDAFFDFIKSYELSRSYGIRVNTLKVSCEDFKKRSPFEIESVPWASEGFYFKENERPAKHPYYHAGLYYIQEPSAMAPGEFINVKPGDKVLDLCAAPGGKSTQVGAKLQGQGVLVSNDVNINRTKALVRNIELFGIKKAVVTNESPEKLASNFEGYFDKIIVDAPCSGEGMFRKDENATKSWDNFSSQRCSVMQKDILQHAAKMLAPGGNIIYSTCTFSPEENEQIIDSFLKNNPEFELVDIPKSYGIESGRSQWGNDNIELQKAARFWPHRLNGEGHFVALLQKNDGKTVKYDKPKQKVHNNIEYFNKFKDEFLNYEFSNNYESYGDYLYQVPDDFPSLNGIKVIRPGWFLGTLKKGRFVPSHALAMGLNINEVKKYIDLDDNLIYKYLKGETLEIIADKGYNLITIDKFPVGWGKGIDNIVKNEYPTAQRLL